MRCSFKATTEAAVKGKIYGICSLPALSEKLVRQKQLRKALLFVLLSVITSAYIQVCISLSRTFTRILSFKVSHGMNFAAFTPYQGSATYGPQAGSGPPSKSSGPQPLYEL